MIEEIKTIARRHLAAEGANLSLRAVARDLGVASSALYRYFASRDELLTALIVDAYNALGDAVEAADAAVTDRADLRGRWLAVSHAVRRWALASPAEYALIFGSPVPGYAAPQDTVEAAVRTPRTLVRILADGVESGALREPPSGPDLPAPVREDIERVRDQTFLGLPEQVLTRGTIAWIHIFGAVSFELFGQLNNVIEAREAYFEHQMLIMAELVGV
jgi:AcrR family transcriptional regulator